MIMAVVESHTYALGSNVEMLGKRDTRKSGKGKAKNEGQWG
jgi:hypothetical protein